jgi:DNA polymerase
MVEFSGNLRVLAGEVLAWHLAAGVDSVIDDVPHDRFQEAAAELTARGDLAARRPVEGAPVGRLPSGERSISSVRPMVPPNPTDDWVREAQARTAAAQTLAALRTELERFEGCALSRTAKSLILATSTAETGLMIIGDAPEADDDRNGEAYLGRPGALLDAMLKAIGLQRADMVLTTAIPWRPPGNRAATVQELEVCTPFLKRQIELVRPRLILALGALPVQMLTGRTETILKLRGEWFDVVLDGQNVRMLASLSPAYLLRQPMQKRFAWRDLKAFRQAVSGSDQKF